jgi:hypothetical protein
MKLYWVNGLRLKWNSTQNAEWSPPDLTPTSPPIPPGEGLSAIAGGLTINSLAPVTNTLTLSSIAGGIRIS